MRRIGVHPISLVLCILIISSTSASRSIERRRISSGDLKKGFDLGGGFILRADSSYYVDKGILKGSPPREQRRYYMFNVRANPAGGKIFYMEVQNNPLCNVPAEQKPGLHKYELVPADTLSNYWVKAINIEYKNKWSVSIMNYLQGCAFWDEIFDISMGYPTDSYLETENGKTRLSMTFTRPVYHVIRIGSEFSSQMFSGLYNASLVMILDTKNGRMDIEARIYLAKPMMHHNGFFFTQLDMRGRDYSVTYYPDTPPIPATVDWLPFKYMQYYRDGYAYMIENGESRDRPYDEGPYFTKYKRKTPPQVLRIASDKDTLSLNLGDFTKLAYTDYYMDLYGVQFPRNALIANYRQFGDKKPGLAALISYTGIGMGWIPAPLLPGEYKLRYSITWKDHADTQLNQRLDRNFPSLFDEAKEEGIESREDDEVLIDKETLITLRDFKEWIHSKEKNNLPNSIKVIFKKVLRRAKSNYRDNNAMRMNLLKHWEAATWSDWRTKWLGRQEVDWHRYWGRSNECELSRLIWESAKLIERASGREKRDWAPRLESAWDKEVWRNGWLLKRIKNTDLSVTGFETALYSCDFMAALYELCIIDKAWGRKFLNGESSSLLEKFLFQEYDFRHASYKPTPDLIKRARNSLIMARVYYLLVKLRVGHDISKSDWLAARDGVQVFLKDLKKEDLSKYYPFSRFMAYPEVVDLIFRFRRDVAVSFINELKKKGVLERAWNSFRWTPNLDSGDHSSRYFANTIYGRYDLPIALMSRMGFSNEEIEKLLAPENESRSGLSIYTEMILEDNDH